MKKILLLSFTLLSGLVFAADNAQQAKDLMSVMKIKEGIEKSFSQVSQFSDAMIDSDQSLNAEEKTKAKEMSKSSTDITVKEMLKMDWEGMFSQVYAEVFTAEELQGLIDFYQSPIGQKFIDKQPELQAATMRRMQTEMMKIMPKIQAATQKSIQDAKQ